MNNLLLIGSGGHCKSIIDSLKDSNQFSKIGLVAKSKDENINYGQVFTIGSDDDLSQLINDGWNYAFVSLGSIGNPKRRKELYSYIKTIGYKVPTIISKNTTISNDAKILDGTFIGKNATINTNVSIGKCSIINTGSIVEHDCTIGDFVHISSGAVLCGNVKIGNDTHIGAGSVIRQDIKIGDNCLIGIGSVVTKDIPSNSLAYGNPCKIIKKN